MNSAPEHALQVVVLAAGASRRFGSPKQLVRIDGRPLLHGAVARAVALAGPCVSVVLGCGAAELAPVLRHSPASVLINRDWAEGIGSSLRTAVRNLPGSCEGVLVCLADQVAVTTQDLARLAEAWRRQPEAVVAASYAGIVGVPAIFPRWSLPDLAALRGDEGARVLLRRYAERVVRVPMPNAEVDIDVPEDLARIAPERLAEEPATAPEPPTA